MYDWVSRFVKEFEEIGLYRGTGWGCNSIETSSFFSLLVPDIDRLTDDEVECLLWSFFITDFFTGSKSSLFFEISLWKDFGTPFL